MGDRRNPHEKIKDYSNLSQSQSGVIDVGDRAKTYVFGEDGPGSIKIIGKTNRAEHDTGSVLKRIAKTNDGRENWGEANNHDGESRNKLELFNADGNVSDDFVALVKEAMEGDEGITLGSLGRANGDYVLDIEVQGRWSTDILKFKGDYVAEALSQIAQDDPSGYAASFASLGPTHVDLKDKTDQVGVFTFDNPDRAESAYHGSNAHSTADMLGILDRGSFMSEAEMGAVVNAALNEKYGLADLNGLTYFGDDGASITVGITNTRGATDTIVLTGSDVAAEIAGFDPSTHTHLNMNDRTDQMVFLDTDATVNQRVTFLSGTQYVQLSADGSVTLKDISSSIFVREDNPNRAWQDSVDEFIFAALSYNGQADLTILAGGQAGDDFMTVSMESWGSTDTLILSGERVGDAIDFFFEAGGQYDFFA